MPAQESLLPARNGGHQQQQRAPGTHTMFQTRFQDNISYSDHRVRAFVLTEQLSIGNQNAEQQSFLLVAVRLLPPALGPPVAPGEEWSNVVFKNHAFFAKRPGGLEYSRRGQEVVLRLLRPKHPRKSVDVATASLFTKMLKVGMLTVAIAHLRRSPLPISAPPPTSQALQELEAAPFVHGAFIESATVCVFYGEKLIESFDVADLFRDQTFEVNLDLDGARLNIDGPVRVQLQHVSAPRHRRMRVERFDPFYMSALRADLEGVWASEQALQAEAAQAAAS